MNGLCLLISGGDYCKVEDSWRDAEYVIACDRGWQYAEKMGIGVDLVVGDFDSSPMPETDKPILRLPSRKDDTDTMIGAKKALELGYRNIVICCAFGGRFDHTLANIQTAAYLVERGARAVLTGADTCAVAFTASRECFKRREGWSLSVFSLSDRAENVSLSGTDYTCANVTLTNGFPLGVSNKWSEEEAYISVDKGILLVVESRLKEGEHI